MAISRYCNYKMLRGWLSATLRLLSTVDLMVSHTHLVTVIPNYGHTCCNIKYEVTKITEL
jgi:hypothetical protein